MEKVKNAFTRWAGKGTPSFESKNTPVRNIQIIVLICDKISYNILKFFKGSSNYEKEI